MNQQKIDSVVAEEYIANLILVIRGRKVILDNDLANLYGVSVKVLNQAVKRNIKRFPEDFMMQLSKGEYDILRSQIVTLKRGVHRKYLPYAFTEQGVAMLSSVLRSDKAIEVNIEIMRTFVKLRSMLLKHKELKRKIEEMESKYDYQFRIIFEAINKLITEEESPKEPIGFRLS